MWLPDLWRWVFKRAARALARGDASRAQQIFSSYTRRRPKDAHAWRIWGLYLAASGEHGQAEAVLREGLKTNRGNPDLLAELGNALSSGTSGPDDPRWIEGGKVLDEALSLAPYHPRALLFQFVRSTYRMDFEEMRRLGRQGSQRMTYEHPEERGTALELAMAMVRVPGLEEEVIGIFQRLAEGSPNHYLSHAYLGVLLEQVNPEKAAAHMQLARERWPREASSTLYQQQESIREEIRQGEADERDARSSP